MKMSQQIHTNKFNSLLNRKTVIAAILLLLLLSSLQDFLVSSFQDGAFYLGESLLFRSFWLFFPVLIYAQIRILKHFSYLNITQRFFLAVVSIITMTFIHALIFALTVYFYSLLFMDHFYTPNKTFLYTLSEDLLKYLLFYTGTAITLYWKNQPSATLLSPNVLPESFTISNGAQKIIVPIAEIQVITASPPYCLLQTADKKHYHAVTLKSLEALLPPTTFIRVHKSAMVNLLFVKSIKSRGNGDYDISMQNESLVRLSRNYVAAFKKSGLIHSA